MVSRPSDGVRAVLDIRPHGSDAADYLVVADQDARRCGGRRPPRPCARDRRGVDVVGAGGDPHPVRSRTRRRHRLRRAGATHGGHCEQIVATDTNPRAAGIGNGDGNSNGLDWDLQEGSLFEPVADERFDLIVSNPPFVVGTGAQDYIYRDSGMVGDGISRALIEQIGEHPESRWHRPDPRELGGHPSTPGTRGSEPGSSRPGWTAWVVQRELADPISYVSLWKNLSHFVFSLVTRRHPA